MGSPKKIAVVGLGYVGLPLAVVLARHHTVIGYDCDARRIAELQQEHDATREVADDVLRASALELTAETGPIQGAGIFIITVPTPVDERNEPDLGAVREACRAVGERMERGAVVVLESTVWPGATEEICGPILAAASGLACGTDFFLGYSPERINPGDRVHGVDKITKVIAGQTPEVVATLREVYGAITEGGVFVASSIATAEAAKVIENAQRDINIAFINEVAMIFQKLGLSTHDVLAAAATKWNFLKFEPGLVGGHCIGVDPYYLAHRALELGHRSEIILAGRRINDGMGGFVAEAIVKRLANDGAKTPDGPILVLGLTFKENLPDLRNSRVVDLVRALGEKGYAVDVHDPLADPAEAKALYGIELHTSSAGGTRYACVVGAVSHETYRTFTAATFETLLKPGGLVADVKGMWRDVTLPDHFARWEL
jgi:UDP-N-acetyl-D-galactosamine dehydrogenase